MTCNNKTYRTKKMDRTKGQTNTQKTGPQRDGNDMKRI